MTGSGCVGVSWNKRMQAWLVFYYAENRRRSRTFNPRNFHNSLEEALAAAAAFSATVQVEKLGSRSKPKSTLIKLPNVSEGKGYVEQWQGTGKKRARSRTPTRKTINSFPYQATQGESHNGGSIPSESDENVFLEYAMIGSQDGLTTLVTNVDNSFEENTLSISSNEVTGTAREVELSNQSDGGGQRSGDGETDALEPETEGPENILWPWKANESGKDGVESQEENSAFSATDNFSVPLTRLRSYCSVGGLDSPKDEASSNFDQEMFLQWIGSSEPSKEATLLGSLPWSSYAN